MSGTPATGPPVDLKYKEAEYQALLGYCGIDYGEEGEEGSKERLRKLREVSAEKLVEAIMVLGIPLFNSLGDEGFYTRGIPSWWTQDGIMSGCEWVDEIMTGDAFFEVRVDPYQLPDRSNNLHHSDSIC
jgi:hypothetical protein